MTTPGTELTPGMKYSINEEINIVLLSLTNQTPLISMKLFLLEQGNIIPFDNCEPLGDL
jgi:hypothetical protein